MTVHPIQWVDLVVVTFLVTTALIIVRMRSLFAAAMLTGIYSLLGAAWMTILDAPDVAFTEAAVGAGISTVLMLGTLSLTGREAKRSTRSPWPSLVIVLVTGAALVYGTLDMPYFGDPDAPIHHHPHPTYIERTEHDIHIPNVVTAVLGSYRGYDTLGETIVVFTAAVGMFILLRGRSRRTEVDG